MKEIWKKIKDFKKNDFLISNFGKIEKDGKYYSPHVNCQGYLMVKSKLVHHLVLYNQNEVMLGICEFS